MGRVKTLAILYEHPTYACGQWVSGRIVLELTDRTEVRALKLHAKGEEFVRWTERHGSGKHRTTRVYSQQLRYFKHKYLVIGTGLACCILSSPSLWMTQSSVAV
ncbi:arrestin domain-containing protein 3-like [Rhinoraja longicauda]